MERERKNIGLARFLLDEELLGGGHLVKVGIISSSDSCPVGLSTHIHLHHRPDVIARKLSTLDNPDTNLDVAERQ